jgi:hypothetical protein
MTMWETLGMDRECDMAIKSDAVLCLYRSIPSNRAVKVVNCHEMVIEITDLGNCEGKPTKYAHVSIIHCFT